MNIHDLHSCLMLSAKNREDFEKVFNTYRAIIEDNVFTPEELQEIGYDIDASVTFAIGDEEIKVSSVAELDALKERLASAEKFFAEQYGQIWSLSPQIATVLEQLSSDTKFYYSEVAFSTCSGEVWYNVQMDGNMTLDYDAAATHDIVAKGFDDWRLDCCYNAASIKIRFDKLKYPDIYRQISDLTNEMVSENDREYVKQWDDEIREDAEGPEELCISGFEWEHNDFNLLQPYLDRVNEIIRPIRDEIKEASFGGFWADIENLAIATVKYDKENGFQVVGCEI